MIFEQQDNIGPVFDFQVVYWNIYKFKVVIKTVQSQSQFKRFVLTGAAYKLMAHL